MLRNDERAALMGMGLVKILLALHSSELNGRAFKVALCMAVTALDDRDEDGRPSRLYFGGEEPLFAALYGAGAEQTENRMREVARVVKELVDADLIQPQVEHPGPRNRQCYRLKFGLELAGENAHPMPGEFPHPVGGDKAHQWVGKRPTPRKTEEDGGLTSEPIPSATTSSTDRAREVEPTIRISPSVPHPFEPDGSGISCEVCGLQSVHNRHNGRDVS